ncbi:MAG TPA: hypothetical protein DC001_01425, partial [Clostridiales bacterium]|nr:hypothetical protein [Clostridiales bacterium]
NSLADRISALNAAIAKYERSGETANDLRDDRNLLLDTLSGLVNISCGGNETNPSMVDVQIGGIDLVTGVSVNRVEADGAYLHTEQIDELTDRIASVNADIAAAAAAGDPTDELTAALDGYIEDLSQFVEISTAADADGVTNILFCGVYLVQGSAQADIASAVEPDMTAWAELYRNRLTLDGASLDIGAGTVTGGSLYAHMEMVRGADAKAAGIPDYMSRLNALARAVAQNVNTIHKMGFTYPADGMPSVDGVNFFNVALIPDGSGGYVEDYSRITAGNFALGDAVLESVYNIAAAAEPVDLSNPATESGNHEIISKLIADLDNSGYYGMLNSIVGHLATTLKSGRSILDTKASLLGSIDTQRTSVSGVSTDEETTNLIVYKQTYQACSRVITAIDEMINTLVNNTGLVGR